MHDNISVTIKFLHCVCAKYEGLLTRVLPDPVKKINRHFLLMVSSLSPAFDQAQQVCARYDPRGVWLRPLRKACYGVAEGVQRQACPQVH